MSPQRYLKRRRLSLVRRALLGAHDRPTSVKMEAMRFGFWHLGRFAADYHACFGEHPGDTLRIHNGV
jgi:AraC family ethanolamine operon transcriptional activator